MIIADYNGKWKQSVPKINKLKKSQKKRKGM